MFANAKIVDREEMMEVCKYFTAKRGLPRFVNEVLLADVKCQFLLPEVYAHLKDGIVNRRKGYVHSPLIDDVVEALTRRHPYWINLNDTGGFLGRVDAYGRHDYSMNDEARVHVDLVVQEVSLNLPGAMRQGASGPTATLPERGAGLGGMAPDGFCLDAALASNYDFFNRAGCPEAEGVARRRIKAFLGASFGFDGVGPWVLC